MIAGVAVLDETSGLFFILSQIAPNVTLTEEEVAQRMKLEYAQFVEEENSFLRELGLKEEEKEELPQIE